MKKVRWKGPALLLVILCALLWLNTVVLNYNANDIQQGVESAGWFAPIFFIILYTIRPFTLFPASIMSLGGGLAFGAFPGVVYIIAGAAAGACLSFLTARKLGKNLSSAVWKGKARGLQEQLEGNGFLYTLLLRLIPVLNFDLVSYVCGISKVRFRAFMAATLIGIIPGSAAYSLLGAGLIDGDATQLMTAAAVFAAIAILAYLLRKLKAGKEVIEQTKVEKEDD
ncbi:TVP38/TMEM64 family protein [Alteribacillus sp. HJP-4]|uniref:TVP38/TMEM64 family protein n=1 Tax=Alteribacillus sp. HJP-4 TaxID=2775394 RepID=UPI0035CD2423